MAGCHSRLQLFLRTRVLSRTVHIERSFYRYSGQQRAYVTSSCKGYKTNYFLQYGWNSSPLKTNLWLSKQTNLRFLHSTFIALSQDKNAEVNKNGDSITTSEDSKKTVTLDPSDGSKEQSDKEEKLSVFQRFKKTYKEHGKVLVCVHLVTSAVWFGSFFYAAKVGVDVIPFMEWLGLSDRIINPFRNSSLGDVALAYLMYKLATPARYTVTLGGTNLAIKYLRKKGVMQPVDKNSSLRSLARDSRTEIKRKRTEVKNKTDQLKIMTKLKERRVKMKDKFTKFKDRRLKYLKSRLGRRQPRPK